MSRKTKRDVVQSTPEVVDSGINKVLTSRHRLKFKNKAQKDYATLITSHEIVISAGPAGVGKSYVAIARAIELLQNKTNKFERILILKPAIEADEKHGFLPGDMREKMEPYVASSLDIIDKIVGEKSRKKLEEMGIIKVEALAYIRGKSIDNSILIMEEAQNMSPSQVKTLLTRIGENSKFIISGDLDQSDRYKNVSESGLYDAIHRHRNLEEIGFYEFTKEDIVRNPIISKILANYTRVDKPISGSTRPIMKPDYPKSQIIREGGSESKKVRDLKARWKHLVRWFRKKFSKKS